MSSAVKKVKNFTAFVLLVTGFVYCVFRYVHTTRELNPQGKRSILIAHWQGERGCESALNEIIADYEKLHPDINVRQQVIVGMGSSFVRWCVTQIIAGTQPDIMEYHRAFQPYLSNYFVGLSEYVVKPNPYNRGTQLEGVPWRDTFYGGMQGSWEPELMDYYTIPNTMYTMRFYYNKDIFRQATGSEAPPQSMKEFLDICAKIKKLGIIPVVAENANGLQGLVFFSSLYSQLFRNLEHEIDYNHDGMLQPLEYLRGVKSGRFQFDTPRMKSLLTLMREAAKYWGKGFNALNNSVAPFMFIQGRGACYLSGSWLGRQMVQSCKFKLGDFPFPLVTKEDPIAGKFYGGPWGENSREPGMSLAVAKGPNQDIAIDFLRFLTTRTNSSRFNAGPCWIPGVLGAKVPKAIKGFKPLIRGKNVEGFLTRSLKIEFRRIMQNFLAGDYDYDKVITETRRFYNACALKDALKASRDSFRRISRLEEIRNDINTQLLEAGITYPGPEMQQRQKLQLLYENQIYSLNIIDGVSGMAASIKEK